MGTAKLIRVSADVVILDARGCTMNADQVAERINEELGFETVGTQLATRGAGEGLYIGPRAQASIAQMRSINASIYVGSKEHLQPAQTRQLVRKHVGSLSE